VKERRRRIRRLVLVLATTALAILLAGGVAQAIINGEPDRGPKAHPYAGAYVAKFEGKLLPVCSGTLISPKVFLTAGHCTEVAIEKDRPAYVSFDPTYKPGASELIKGTPYLHPKFCLGAKQGEAMNQGILPLATTMMAGPQIMSANIFVTASKPLKVSASFIAGVTIATTVGVAIALAAVSLLGNSVSLGESSNSGSIGHIIKYLLV
jgi:hypothetical protein